MENKDMADVLDLSRIEAGKEKIDIGDCQPRQIVAEVLSLMKTRADIKGLELAMETRGAVPRRFKAIPRDCDKSSSISSAMRSNSPMRAAFAS